MSLFTSLRTLILVFLAPLAATAQTNDSRLIMTYGSGFTVEVERDEICSISNRIIQVDEPAVAAQLLAQPNVLWYLRENYGQNQLSPSDLFLQVSPNDMSLNECVVSYQRDGSISFRHGDQIIAELAFENNIGRDALYTDIQPLSPASPPFENEHLRLIWAEGNLRSTREILDALTATADPYALHILATRNAAGTRILDLGLGNPKRVDSPELDRAVALGYAPSMVLKARILLQQNNLETPDAFRDANPEVLNSIRALVNGALAQGAYSALVLREALLDLEFDLTEADAVARAAEAQDQRTKAGIRSAMISVSHEACTSAELRALSAATGGLLEGIPIRTGCRLQNSFGFYADLGFSDVRLLGCTDDSCRFETVNQCYARGAIFWGTCGDHIDNPWSGTYQLDGNQRPTNIVRRN